METTRRAAKAKSPSASREAVPATPAKVREPRGARRKRETRDKLLRAAFRLIAERGIDAVAINEITEAADVGFGSFYNHFESKEVIYESVFHAIFEDFADALEKLTDSLTDPAELIAVCVRHTITRARQEPLWGAFLLRESYRNHVFSRGLGARLLRDIRKGVAQKRFVVEDPLMTVILVGATILGTIAAERGAKDAVPAQLKQLKQLGMNVQNLEQRATATVLQNLGLSAADARTIAKRALPVFDWPAAFVETDRSGPA